MKLKAAININIVFPAASNFRILAGYKNVAGKQDHGEIINIQPRTAGR